MSNRQAALWIYFLIPLTFYIVGPYSVNDLAGWIAHGLYFLDHHQILRRDIFSVLPTRPLIYPAWGISVVYALLYRVLGLLGVCVFHGVIIGALILLVYQDSLFATKGPSELRARLAIYCFWLGSVAAFGERPSTVALIPLVLSYRLISSIRRASDLNRPLILKLCLLNILWVNIHGSFILLLLMLVWKLRFLAIKDGLTRALAVPIVVGLTSLINPFGVRVFPFLLETAEVSKRRILSEWAPTTPLAHFPTGILFFLLLAGSAYYVFKIERSRRWDTLSNPFFFLLLNGLTAIRNAALPFIILLPALYQEGLLSAEEAPRVERNPANFAKVGAFAALLVIALPWVKTRVPGLIPSPNRPIYDSTAPVLIAERIRGAGQACAVFNSWETGGYLLLAQPNPIFVDGRNIIYTDEDFWKYAQVLRAKPGWEEYLSRYRACFTVLNEGFDAPLIEALRSSPRWAEVMTESGNILFELRGRERGATVHSLGFESAFKLKSCAGKSLHSS